MFLIAPFLVMGAKALYDQLIKEEVLVGTGAPDGTIIIFLVTLRIRYFICYLLVPVCSWGS